MGAPRILRSRNRRWRKTYRPFVVCPFASWGDWARRLYETYDIERSYRQESLRDV